MLKSTALALAACLTIVGTVLADETFNPPVAKHGYACKTADDVSRFVTFLKTVPGTMPVPVALELAHSRGIQCSPGSAMVTKEEVVGHFDWMDGSKMVILHLTIVGGDVYTWREDASATKTSCTANNCI